MVSTILGTAFGLLLIFLASGMYIAAALGLLGLSLDLLFDDRPLWKYTADMMWWPSTNFVLFLSLSMSSWGNYFYAVDLPTGYIRHSLSG